MNFELWMLFVVLAIIAALFEMFIPTLLAINFAFAGIVTAIISIFWGSLGSLTLIFIVLSLLSILFIKPMLTKHIKQEADDDFEQKYIGKIVKSISKITCVEGAVTIYDERWKARTRNEGEEIPENCDVKITGHENTILFVEKI